METRFEKSFTYDHSGIITSEIYKKNGTITEEKYYKYDDKGRKMEITDNLIIDNVFYISKYEYDEMDRVINEISYNRNGQPLLKHIYNYGKMNELISKTEYSMLSDVEELVEKNEFHYNDTGKRDEWINFNAEGKVAFKCNYKYDLNDNMTDEIIYSSEGKIVSFVKLIYDAKNIREKRVVSDKNDTVSSTVYKYDSKGKEIEREEKRKSWNIISVKWISEYDRIGNITKCLEYRLIEQFGTIENVLDEVRSWEYEYY
jgi:hypothetical protein